MMHTIVQKKIILIDPDKIKPSLNPIRSEFDDYELSCLSDSISAGGMIQPLPVRKAGSGYRLISGERRLKAAKMSGIRRVPCVVHDVDDNTAILYGILENLQSSGMSFFDEAKAIDLLISKKGMSVADTAARLGISQSTLYYKLQLLRLDDSLVKRIVSAGLTERHARALLQLPKDERTAALEVIIADDLTAKQSEAYVFSVLSPTEKTECKIKSEPEPEPKSESESSTKPVIKAAIGDLRLFSNSLFKLVETLKSGGVNAVSRKYETEKYIEYRVRIKKGASESESWLQLKM